MDIYQISQLKLTPKYLLKVTGGMFAYGVVLGVICWVPLAAM